MSNIDVLIDRMIEDEGARSIILVSLISSDNDPDTTAQRLETLKNLKVKVEENKQTAIVENNGGVVERLDSLLSNFDNCISILERDIAEMEVNNGYKQ